LKVEVRLAEGFVPGLEERASFRFILGAKAELLPSFVVLAVKGGVSLTEDKALFHNSGLNHDLVRHARVSE